MAALREAAMKTEALEVFVVYFRGVADRSC